MKKLQMEPGLAALLKQMNALKGLYILVQLMLSGWEREGRLTCG